MQKSKIEEFKIAMDNYNNNYLYNRFGLIISNIIIVAQLVSAHNVLLTHYHIKSIVEVIGVIATLVSAYILTDFINGIIHMYMDNNTCYASVIGPFVAAFHMHHKHLQYKKRNPIMVYFIESGSKVWLVGYLGILIYLQYTISLYFYLDVLLVAIGFFSSFAEVSHYLCHNTDKNNLIIGLLQKIRVLLPKNHHTLHHTQDNVNYAFLNGITDPIINVIARYLYSGYKNNSDLHVLAYDDKHANNRN
jgi:hypothetical protein